MSQRTWQLARGGWAATGQRASCNGTGGQRPEDGERHDGVSYVWSRKWHIVQTQNNTQKATWDPLGDIP